MIRSLTALKDATIEGKEGELGSVLDACFDREQWVIRYLIMTTDNWLAGRHVLVSPLLLRGVDWEEGTVNLPLYREEIEAIPEVDPGAPVTRRQEKHYNRYFCLPDYWKGQGIWGEERSPAELAAWLVSSQVQNRSDLEETSHLHRTEEVVGLGVNTPQGEIGRIEDFLIDEDSFAVRYLVTDISDRIHEKKVLIAPLWTIAVEAGRGALAVNLPLEAIRESPAYEPGQPIPPEYDEQSAAARMEAAGRTTKA